MPEIAPMCRFVHVNLNKSIQAEQARTDGQTFSPSCGILVGLERNGRYGARFITHGVGHEQH